MKKINGLILSFVTAGFLVGCGGGGGGGSSGGESTATTTTNQTTSPNVTDVTVERGAVYNSVVTDANGQIAIQKDGQNVYSFASIPIYPIKATGGIIDVDGNGIDDGDIELTTPLTSYSNVISPITDYLGDTTTDSGKTKLAKLKEISGASDDELLKKAPSVVGKSELLALTNAIFSIKNDDDSTNDDFVSSYDNSVFKTKFEELKVLASGIVDKKAIAKALEQKVVNDLQMRTLNANEAQRNIAETGVTVDKLKISDVIERGVSFDENNYYTDGPINNEKNYHFEYNQGKFEWVLVENNNLVPTEIKNDETNPYKAYITNPKTGEQFSANILSTKKIDSLNGSTYTDLYKTTFQIELLKEGNSLDWYRSSANPSATTINNEKIAIVDIDSFIKVYTSLDEWLYFPIRYNFNNQTIFFNADGTLVSEELKIININGLPSARYTRGTEIVGSWKRDGDQIIATSRNETRYFRVVLDNGNYYIEDADVLKVGFRDSSTLYTGKDLDLLVSNIKSSPIFLGDRMATSASQKQTTVEYTPFVKNDILPVTYSLSGEDANKFNIDSVKGTITFKIAPTYETAKKIYTVYVVATNTKNQTAKQKLQILVLGSKN